MIQYPISLKALNDLVDEENRTWRTRAVAKTNAFRVRGDYDEKSSIWSEVKSVYMTLQKCKCAYCERELEGVEIGKIEQDVEHYRPKGNIKKWKPSSTLRGIKFGKLPPKKKGYHLLPYHVFNYAAACKPCNSTLKKDYFPIKGTYDLDSEDPVVLRAEEPYLLYPIGHFDDDPETVIKFNGVSPTPVASEGFKRERALVTIDFFKLDDPVQRKSLYRGRSYIIMALFPLLQQTQKGNAAAKKKAIATVEGYLKPGLQHLNCAKNFQSLFNRDKAAAKVIYDAAIQFVTSVS